ncbi:MAG: hypothetical protein ABJA57_13225 [Ginsengibacter sp.]
MKTSPGIILNIMLIMSASSCELSSFNSDKRQIIAKDEIRSKIGMVTEFDILSFREDTLRNSTDTNFINPIRYTLDITFKDSGRVMLRKKGVVLFTPAANQVISSSITDP